MDIVSIATLAGVLLIGIERILTRLQCPGCHGFSHVDLAVSRCCHLDIERTQSPPGSPAECSATPAALEQSVEHVLAQIESRRGSILSPSSSHDLKNMVASS